MKPETYQKAKTFISNLSDITDLLSCITDENDEFFIKEIYIKSEIKQRGEVRILSLSFNEIGILDKNFIPQKYRTQILTLSNEYRKEIVTILQKAQKQINMDFEELED